MRSLMPGTGISESKVIAPEELDPFIAEFVAASKRGLETAMFGLRDNLANQWSTGSRQRSFRTGVDTFYSGSRESDPAYRAIIRAYAVVQALADMAREVGQRRLAGEANGFCSEVRPELTTATEVRNIGVEIMNWISERWRTGDSQVYKFASESVRKKLDELAGLDANGTGFYHRHAYCAAKSDLLTSEKQNGWGFIDLPEMTDGFSGLRDTLFDLVYENEKRYGRGGELGYPEIAGKAIAGVEYLCMAARRCGDPEGVMSLFVELARESVECQDAGKKGICDLAYILMGYATHAYMMRDGADPNTTLQQAFGRVDGVNMGDYHSYVLDGLMIGADLGTAQERAAVSAKERR